jgi:hypothetical protein
MPGATAQLPAAAGTASARTASAESSKAAATASKTSTATVTAATVASSTSAEEQEVKEDLAQRSQQHDQENDAENEQLFPGQLWPGLELPRELRTVSRQFYAGILRDDVCHSRRHQRNRALVVVLPEQRDRLAANASHFSVGQDRLQSVADFDAVSVVLRRQEDQDSMVCSFAADAPLLVQGDGIAFYVGSVQRIYCDYSGLSMRFLIELLADVIQLRDGGRVENVGEIVDVVGGTQLRDRLCPKQQRERQQDDGDADRLQKPHPCVIV